MAMNRARLGSQVYNSHTKPSPTPCTTSMPPLIGIDRSQMAAPLTVGVVHTD